LPLLESLPPRHPDDANLLLVGHGGLFRLMLPQVLANLDQAFVERQSLDHTVCIIAERQRDHWLCLEWGGLPIDTTGRG
jgi:broad specificity phosphatase PhoE